MQDQSRVAAVNADGETFEDNPPPGDYLTCPLYDCKYKLRRMSSQQAVMVGAELVHVAAQLKTVQDLAHEALRASSAREEALVKAHLKTHGLLDFYRTCEHIKSQAQKEVARLMRLADLVFVSTATQETTEKGG